MYSRVLKAKFFAQQIKINGFFCSYRFLISVRVDRASATETLDSGSILGLVQPKIVKIGIHKLPCLTLSV